MEAQSGDVINRERDFFNEQDGRYLRMRAWIWRAIGEFNRNSELYDLYDPRGKRVLLYGCGPAFEAAKFIQAGATHVAGIDISDSESSQAWRTAREGGYDDQVDFRAGDAHATGFPDDSFDLIVGSASCTTLMFIERWSSSAAS
jgi:SAM-dependent methyltransferase